MSLDRDCIISLVSPTVLISVYTNYSKMCILAFLWVSFLIYDREVVIKESQRGYIAMVTDPFKIFLFSIGICWLSFICSGQTVSELSVKTFFDIKCHYMPGCTVLMISFYSVLFA